MSNNRFVAGDNLLAGADQIASQIGVPPIVGLERPNEASLHCTCLCPCAFPQDMSWDQKKFAILSPFF